MALSESTIALLAPFVQKMYDGLKSQEFQRSMFVSPRNGREMCAYRGTDGLKCAIGHIISDENYSPEMEGNGVGDLLVFRKTDMAPVLGDVFDMGDDMAETPQETFDFRDLICHIQNIHDSSVTADLMRKNFVKFCKEKQIPLNK